jgi:hypothetical protein
MENFVQMEIELKPSQWRLVIRSVVIGLILMIGVLLAACGGVKQTNNTNGLQITVSPAPEGVNGKYLTIQLTDASGKPVTDAVVSLEGNMQHAGMAPVTTNGVRDEADGNKDGKYQAPFAFTMLGDWVLSVSVQKADGAKVQQDINVTASEQGVTVKNAK